MSRKISESPLSPCIRWIQLTILSIIVSGKEKDNKKNYKLVLTRRYNLIVTIHFEWNARRTNDGFGSGRNKKKTSSSVVRK